MHVIYAQDKRAEKNIKKTVGTKKVFLVLHPGSIEMKPEQQILKGAEELFFRYGLKGITMDDIAKHLGMSKRTIYEHFPTKDSIISALLKAHTDKNSAQIKNFHETAKDAVEEIFMTMQELQSMFSVMNPRLLFELKKFHPKVWSEFEDFKRNVILQSVVDNIKTGIKQGIYRDDLDLEILSRLRIEEVEMAWNPELFPPSTFDLGRTHIALIDHFLHGLVNINGFRLIEKYKKLKNIKLPS
ncbi:MAG TPA: TetR/AcrR family transcriptional regulator [Bacteroidia bacterium]|jgi:AcrR family transcriptional regulator|nr:TetR/AcrR family transcriptional regulator [Bacteroidia bacterium]